MKSEQSIHDASERPTRRRFAKAIFAATIAAAPLASAPSSDAQTPTAPKQSPAPPNPQPPTTSTVPTKSSPLAEAYAEVSRARFGGQVSPEEFSRIKTDIEGNLRTAERLAAFKLQNSDEPDFIFGA
ncbi:MAG: hypothetical protein M3430_15585 [Acidobacteriota bacterium]|nr:hypothetical protein [Acidobacteriota bacterium]